MTEHAVEVTGLTRTFGERTALDGVDLVVPAGAIFGLLGPNGSGKSTLFRILSTLLAPSGGNACVFGYDVVGAPARVRERIGVVFQSPSLDKKLTVGENLRCQGQLYGLSGPALAERIRELTGRFGLADRVGELVQTLSGGLARRIEIAKGMIHRPRLLLLDESGTGLDPGARLDLWRQLEDVRENDGVTVLMTTHLMEEADGCDQLVLLNEGRVVAAGKPEELKKEIPGEVVTIETAGAQSLSSLIEERFGLAGRVFGRSVRLVAGSAHELAGRIAEAFGDRIQSLTVGRPTLEDVFLEKTGRRLTSEDGSKYV